VQDSEPAGNSRSNVREEYVRRINRVIDYIEANPDKDLSLETLAGIACFSRFHFHRIFGAITGEALGQFIQRVRLQKAASKLIGNPKRSITQIAFESGFSTSAGFARAFREAFGMSAREWRSAGFPANRKIGGMDSNFGKTVSNTRKDLFLSSLYIEGDLITQTWRIRMKEKPKLEATVEIREVPDQPVAYVRHIGPYSGNDQLFKSLFGKLMTWAGPRGLIRFPDTKMLTIYYEDPSITEESKLRVDACITVPEGTPAEGEIGRMTIPGGKNAVAGFEITPDQYGDAWNAVYGGWLPESGYQSDERPCYEVYLNEPAHHPEGKHIIEIHAPVKPL
jgi:AraC family transcriptional regulator